MNIQYIDIRVPKNLENDSMRDHDMQNFKCDKQYFKPNINKNH